ncbi:MAG: hypothetical protein JOZ19_14235 [Rubrobacter sp.]|nr:hypothetical protein [Rubrobacter sp.]
MDEQTTTSLLNAHQEAAQAFSDAYLQWQDVNQEPRGPEITDNELHKRAMEAVHGGQDDLLSAHASRYLFTHRQLRDSLADLAVVLDTISGDSVSEKT